MCVHSKSLPLCLTLCDPMDCRSPGSSVQARILEWVSIPFSRGLPSPGMNLGLSHCRQILYHRCHQGSPTVIIILLLPLHVLIIQLDEANWNMHKIHFNTYTVPYINIFIYLLFTDPPYAAETPVNLHATFLCKRGSFSGLTRTVPFIWRFPKKTNFSRLCIKLIKLAYM